MSDWKERYKDADPNVTIEKIDRIFDNIGFKIKYEESNSGENGCYSSKLKLIDDKGRELTATNGKGMSKLFAKASAYGEMMERLQNRMTNAMINLLDKKFDDFQSLSKYSLDLNSEDIIPCIKNIIDDFINTMNFPGFYEIKRELVNNILLDCFFKTKDNKCIAFPMYSVKEKKNVLIPAWINNLICSNGMAAGNTLEEAIVEGMSEIFERYSNMEVMDGKIIPPQIPVSELDKYPNIKKIIDGIENNGNYKVRILDCSLGLGLPVVCGIIINKNTGSFCTKFGAHPDMGIALERVFTESMQGIELEKAVERNYVDFFADTNTERIEKWNLLKIGVGRIPAELLMDTPTYEYKSWGDTSLKSNKDLLKDMLNLVNKLGKELFIKDVSFLGFPAVQIYIPKMSESHTRDFITLKEWKLKSDVIRIFERLNDITEEDIKKIKLLSKLNLFASLENTINAFSGNRYNIEMPGYPFEMHFLHIVCCICLKDYKEAIQTLIQVKSYNIDNLNTKCLYEVLYCYVSGLDSGKEYSKICNILMTLFPKYADYVIDLFSDTKKTLMKLYPNCNEHNCESCNIKECMYKEIHAFNQIIDKKANQNMPDGKELEKLINEIS